MSALGIDRPLAVSALALPPASRSGEQASDAGGFDERLDERLAEPEAEQAADTATAPVESSPELQSEVTQGAPESEPPSDEAPEAPSVTDANDTAQEIASGAQPEQPVEADDRAQTDGALPALRSGDADEVAPEPPDPPPSLPTINTTAAGLPRGVAGVADAIARQPLPPATALGILAAGPLDIASLNALLLRLDPRVADSSTGNEPPTSVDEPAGNGGDATTPASTRSRRSTSAIADDPASRGTADVLRSPLIDAEPADPSRRGPADISGEPREARATDRREDDGTAAAPLRQDTTPQGPPTRTLGVGVGVAASPTSHASAQPQGLLAGIRAPSQQSPTVNSGALAFVPTRTDRDQAQRVIQQSGHAQPRAALDAQLTRGVSAALAQRPGPVLLRLAPEELGQIRVHVDVRGAAVGVRVEAASESARGLLVHSGDSLRAALERQGLSLTALRVEVTDALAEPGVGGGTGVADAALVPTESSSERPRSGARRRPRERGE